MLSRKVQEICIIPVYMGELNTSSGRTEKATGYLYKAESMFREMGMDYLAG